MRSVEGAPLASPGECASNKLHRRIEIWAKVHSPQIGSAGKAAIDCSAGNADRCQHAPVRHLRTHQRKSVIDVVNGGNNGQSVPEIASIPATQKVHDHSAS